MEKGADSRHLEGLSTSADGLPGRSLSSPLSLDGWVEFNRNKWGLQPVRLRLGDGGKQQPAIDMCVYLDRHGRIRQPQRNPYLPVEFYPTPTEQPGKIHRQWLSLSGMLSDEFRKRGLGGQICFPPTITDVREFQWRGYVAQPSYTFLLDIPYHLANADHSVRKQIAKATRLGYRCEQTQSFEDICCCLEDTEERQGFRHNLVADDLRLASQLLGDSVFRCYACYSSNGRPASARIVLRHPGGLVLDWVAGTMRDHLTSGVTQLLISYVLDDLGKSGAAVFDYCGANIRTVAASKATWGGRLQSFYSISAPNLKGLARFVWRDMRTYGRWLEW